MEKQPQLDENQLNPNIIELEKELAEISEEVSELKQYDRKIKQKITRSQISRSNCSSSAYSRRLSNNLWSQLKLIAFSSGIAAIVVVCGWKLAQQQTQPKTPTQISIKTQPQTITKSLLIPFSQFQPQTQKIQRQDIQKLTYNVKTPPEFQKSQKLQKIVDEVVSLAKKRGMPTASLSVTLIDLNSREEASYQQEKLRFPASVVKLFWLVNLQAQIHQGILSEDETAIVDLPKMIAKSDNEAASRVVARITQTQSGSNLNQQEFNNWLNQRKQVNRFFETAGYQGINVSQKTFPIPYLHLSEPQGRELQMRVSLEKPIRNKITTQQASRLMYEIVTRQAVSPEASQAMQSLLTIDATTRIQKKTLQDPNTFNPVRGYLSQSLPDDVYFAAKAGWTSWSRQETAYIATPDQKTTYILTIFAEDKSYAYNWKIFPEISTQVFERMTKRR